MATSFLFSYSFGHKHYNIVKMPIHHRRMPKLVIKHRPTDDAENDTALSTRVSSPYCKFGLFPHSSRVIPTSRKFSIHSSSQSRNTSGAGPISGTRILVRMGTVSALCSGKLMSMYITSRTSILPTIWTV